MKNDIKLYNVLFPIWLLVIFPVYWIGIIPANLIIDFVVMLVTMKLIHTTNTKLCIKKSLIPVWLFGFLSDFIGVGILFSSYLLGLIPALSENKSYNDIISALGSNPFENIFAFLWVFIAVAVSGVMIYIFNRFISFRKLPIDLREKKILALSLAAFTAPYLFFLPSSILY